MIITPPNAIMGVSWSPSGLPPLTSSRERIDWDKSDDRTFQVSIVAISTMPAIRLDNCLEWCSLQALSKCRCKYATIPLFPHSTPNDSYAQPSSYSSGMTNHTPSHMVSHNWSCQIKSPPSVKFDHAPSHVVSHDWVMTSSHDPNHQSQLWPFVVRPTHYPDMEQSHLVARWVIGSHFRSSSVQ